MSDSNVWDQTKKTFRWDPVSLAEKFHLEIAGEVLQELDRRDWSQAKLAEEMNVSEARVSQMFHDTSNFTLESLGKIASALQMEWRHSLVKPDHETDSGSHENEEGFEEEGDTASSPRLHLSEFDPSGRSEMEDRTTTESERNSWRA